MLVRSLKNTKCNKRAKTTTTTPKANMILHNNPKPSIRLVTLFIVIIQVSLSLQFVQPAHGALRSADNYEPERQTDGPPAEARPGRNLANLNSDAADQSDDDAEPAATRSIVRRADLDPEEEFDDDERDEDKSGSSQHGSFENPSFGESPRAAKDGEDIESFFDKHLGPPTDAVSGNSDDTEPSQPVVSERIDPDDGYETAASTPLTDIFHTLIKAHRRPFVITTTSGGGSAADDTPASSENQPQQQQAQQQPGASGSTSAAGPAAVSTGGQSMTPSASSSSMSAPSQPMSPMLRGTPYMDPSPFPIMAQAAAMSPLAYFAPIAAPSTLQPYEPAAAMSSAGASVGAHHQEEYPGGAGREIYIVRRPSVLQHIRAVAPPLQRLVQQSSNAHWTRGLPYGHPQAYAPRPYPAEEPPAGADYHNYHPVGAYSYAHQREQPQREPQSSADDEPGTVSYGLSFGGSSSAAAADSANDEPEGGPEEQSSVDEPSQTHSPYHSGYSSMRNPVRYTSSTRAYNNYNYPPPPPPQPMGPYGGAQAAYMRQSQGPMAPPHQYQQQQQHHYHGARYHKDPSESAVQPVNYANQYSPMHSGSNQGDYASWATRQQLLAHLDRQIKNNQYYRQNTATAPTNQHHRAAPITVRRRFKTRLSKDDGDVDTYSSFHSEVDPYKSFTASSKLVNEPQTEKARQKGANRDESSSGSRDRNDDHLAGGDTADNTESGDQKGDTDQIAENSSNEQPKPNRNLMVGPVSARNHQPSASATDQATAVATTDAKTDNNNNNHSNHRVRREDADDRENDEADDAGEDGVWVDDDDDDDNRQTASDLNETTQDPEEEENQQEGNRSAYTPGVIGNPHGYELSR